MRVQAILAGVLTVAVAFTSVDLLACGDKFVRVGRSIRLGGYAPMYPATILVYQPAKASVEGMREFESLLTKAGHTVVFIPQGSDIARAAATTSFDLVIANHADIEKVVAQTKALATRPDVVPIFPTKAAKGVEQQALQEFHCVLAPYRMGKIDALEEIDHAMAVRLKRR